MGYRVKGSEEITNSADVIDGRDVSDRIEYLESERESLESAVIEAQEALSEAESAWIAGDEPEACFDATEFNEAVEEASQALKEWDESEEAEELKKLKALYDGISRDSTLIRDSHFREYAEQLAGDDLGYTEGKMRWPYTCIDWEQAAEELQSDYSCVDFDGVTYYARD